MFLQRTASCFYNHLPPRRRIAKRHLLLREVQYTFLQAECCEILVFQMKISLPTAVSTGSFRKRHPPGRRIRAISAKISALCRVALPGMTPDKITSKLDSLWAAAKKEGSSQPPAGPQGQSASPSEAPLKGCSLGPGRMNPDPPNKCSDTTIPSKRGDEAAALSPSH